MGTPDKSLKGTGVATAQTALNSSSAVAILTAKSRVFAEIKNVDASISIYVGDTGVTSSTGYLVKAGEAFQLDNFVGVLYAIAASATPTVHTIQW